MQQQPHTILVVDDSEDSRDLLARYLKQRGSIVVGARDGREALALVHEQPFDLMLLDIMMPHMDGYQVLEQLQADPQMRHLPVIVISALHDIDSAARCIELGAEDYLFKPFNPILLASRINSCLEKKRLHNQEQAYLEELLIMRQIDRELNANLDVQQAMSTTLGWAIRRTGADAGLIGLIEQGFLRVISAVGYEDSQAVAPESRLALEDLPAHPVVIRAQAEQTGVAMLKQRGLLPGAMCCLLVPIDREAAAIGMLILESRTLKECDDSTVAFLTRLSNHAAVAVANAQLYAEVQLANRAKSDFVAFVAHELRTPLTAIRGYADLLLRGIGGSLNEAQAGFLRSIGANTDLMTTLVSDLSIASRIESGQLELERGRVSIADAVDVAMTTLKEQIVAKEQTLALDIPDTLPDVWADRTRVIQICTNLLSNAHKYTPRGGRISVSARPLSDQRGDMAFDVACIAVRDTGIGIDPAERPKIFQKFFRSSDEQARKAPGSGLGLHITRNLVELHGGRIWFESGFGTGTTFFFTLPAALPDQLPQPGREK